jgi:hypothetical protein
MDFSDLTFPPRDPTNAERKHILSFHPELEPSTFKMMGNRSWEYNCLGWAVQRVTFINDYPERLRIEKMASYMAQYGYEPTRDESLAVIDVWATRQRDGRNRVQHFSRKTSYGWTSKLGKLELIQHERYAFQAEGPRGNVDYGRVIGHFKEQEVVLPEETTDGSTTDQKEKETG